MRLPSVPSPLIWLLCSLTHLHHTIPWGFFSRATMSSVQAHCFLCYWCSCFWLNTLYFAQSSADSRTIPVHQKRPYSSTQPVTVAKEEEVEVLGHIQVANHLILKQGEYYGLPWRTKCIRVIKWGRKQKRNESDAIGELAPPLLAWKRFQSKKNGRSPEKSRLHQGLQ